MEQLVQKSLPFTKLVFTIQGNRELVVEHSTLFRSTRQAFPLHLIDPSPIHHRSIPVGWVVFTLIPLLGLLGAIMDGWITKGPGEQFGILLLSGMFLACLYNTVKLSSNTLHYRNANTAAVLLSLFRGKPSSASVDAFVETLSRRIESFRTPVGANSEETVALYRRHLDYLLENEVLLRNEYDAIVQRLQEKATKKRVFELVR